MTSLNFQVVHALQKPFVFAPKNPHHRLPKILRWYACGADGQSVYGHVITKFSRIGSLPQFVTYGAPLRVLRARELRYDSVILRQFLEQNKR